MSHIFNPDKMHKLDNPQRRMILPPRETLLELGLKEDDIFFDIGCGIGYFTIPAAEFLTSNQIVTGVDTSAIMIDELQLRAAKEKIKNLQLMQSEEYDLKVKKESFSFALMVNVLHEIDDKNRFLTNINEFFYGLVGVKNDQ